MSQPAEQTAYDYKYTDKDVRENPNLREIATKYVEEYGGDFAPLVNIKLGLVHDEDELTTAEARIVLNCMRHDSTVNGSLPAPRFGVPADRPRRDAVVIPMQRDRRSARHRGPVEHKCGRTQPHDEHFTSGYDVKCPGVPWEITRYGLIPTRGRIHGKPYAASATGALVHKVEGEAVFYWRPNRHEWGFETGLPVQFSVKVLCKNPSWLKDPKLYAEEPVHLYDDDSFGRSRCKRCFTVVEMKQKPVEEMVEQVLKDIDGGPIGLAAVQFLPPVCMIPDCGCDGTAHA